MDCVAIHRYIISERTLIISSCSLKLLLTKHTHIYMSLPGTYFGFSLLCICGISPPNYFGPMPRRPQQSVAQWHVVSSAWNKSPAGEGRVPVLGAHGTCYQFLFREQSSNHEFCTLKKAILGLVSNFLIYCFCFPSTCEVLEKDVPQCKRRKITKLMVFSVYMQKIQWCQVWC